MEVRDQVSSKEDKLYKVTSALGAFAWKKKLYGNSKWRLTLKEALEIMGIPPERGGDTNIDAVICGACRAGSRFVKGCIAFQLYGDSEEVMKWAYYNGAVALITSKKMDDLPCIVVDNPTEAYVKLCSYYRSLTEAEITAVVGSIGKTTTKRMINAVYSAKYNTFNDPENENQIDCVGYICQHIPKGTQKMVQEISEDTQGSVQFISRMIHPKIAVVTAIDQSHFEEFGSKEKIYEEVLSVVDGMPEDGTIIVNLDEISETIFRRNTLTISMENAQADFYAEEIKIDEIGLHFKVVEKDGTRTELLLRDIFAKHNIYAALYSFAAGICSGVPRELIKHGLSQYRTAGIRQNVFRTSSGVLVYADCYNAVPKSISAAVQAVDLIPSKGKRIAVLGDVSSTGDITKQTHDEIVSIINDSRIDLLMTAGTELIEAIERNTMRSTIGLYTFKNNTELSEQLAKNVQQGDIVLFKGSRTEKLEKVIKTVFPNDFRKQMIDYYMPIIRWRLRVIMS